MFSVLAPSRPPSAEPACPPLRQAGIEVARPDWRTSYPVRRFAVRLCWLLLLGGMLLGAACTPPNGQPPQATMVFRGLDNPRGIAFGPDGHLYIAEAGTGGSTRPDVGPRGRRYRVGTTSRLSRIDTAGRYEVVLNHLPSMSNGADELGAADVTFIGDTLYLLTAAGGYELGDPAWDNVVLRVDPVGPPGRSTPVFNLTTYNLSLPPLSRADDPIRADVHGGMPFGLAGLGDALFATDGNLETVTRIALDGTAERIVQFPTSNHVLTGIAAGPDGALYVAEFGPSPHQPNSARVMRVTPSGEVSTVAEGFVDLIDITFDAHGQLYVLEFGGAGQRVPESGRVLRILPNGQQEVVARNLNYATAMTFGPDQNLYVAVGGHRSPDGMGRIVRIEVAPPSWPLTTRVALATGVLAGLALVATLTVRRWRRRESNARGKPRRPS
ncbi:MAG: ScyD/ScyE family protein [Chloroflexi bacterium]|nr:ScyD/ScyE family protein [Chloroflexota bacterium]